MSDVVISVRDLTKTYQVGDIEVRALRGASLDVHRGEFVCVTGPSGSGKSTFMHIVGCLDRPTSGQYFLDGKDVSKLSKDELASVRNKKIGFVFQGFNLLSRTTALDNVELPLLYNGGSRMKAAERHRRAKDVLEIVGLGQRLDHYPNQLSGGQQQRVALARALINEPAILLADEPTGNLDSKTSHEIMEVIRTLNREQGVTVVVVTHEQAIAAYADRIIVMRDGQILTDTPNKAASARPGPPSPPPAAATATAAAAPAIRGETRIAWAFISMIFAAATQALARNRLRS